MDQSNESCCCKSRVEKLVLRNVSKHNQVAAASDLLFQPRLFILVSRHRKHLIWAVGPARPSWRTEIEDTGLENVVRADLVELSSKTGLIVRSVDSAAVNCLFAELEKYDPEERAETFSYLKRALNETRESVGAEPVYRDT